MSVNEKLFLINLNKQFAITIKLYFHNLKIINEKYFLTYNYIFSMFNLITFEIIQIIEDGLLYILTLKFLINY